MPKKVLVISVFLILCLVFTGCGLLNKVKQDFDKTKETLEDSEFDSPLVLIETPEDFTPVTSDTKLVTLYFADPFESKLVAEEREIPKVTGIARATIEELIKGPLGLELQSTLPASTRLLDVNVREDGLAIVDFSGDLITGLSTTAMAENLAVYSIVNTLTQFPTVQEVEIRVDSRRVNTLLGHVELQDNLCRDTSVIK